MNGKSLDEVILSCDKDGNGIIDYNEFKVAMLMDWSKRKRLSNQKVNYDILINTFICIAIIINRFFLIQTIHKINLDSNFRKFLSEN